MNVPSIKLFFCVWFVIFGWYVHSYDVTNIPK
jgi:hypothetical protein